MPITDFTAGSGLAERMGTKAFSAEAQGGPLPGSPGREGFIAEVEALRAELAAICRMVEEGDVLAAVRMALAPTELHLNSAGFRRSTAVGPVRIFRGRVAHKPGKAFCKRVSWNENRLLRAAGT